MNVLVTGASRGIGLGLTAIALKKGHTVFAVTRNPQALNTLQGDYAQSLVIIDADISQPLSLKMLMAKVEEKGGLDILINNAGMMKPDETYEALTESFQVNAIIPFLLTKAMTPILRKSKNPKVVQISTKMASIEDNTSGGYYAYRSSKTALNMLTRSLKIDHPEITFALIHPGWVKTDMGGDNAPVDVMESTQGIWKVIDLIAHKDSGKFIDFQGNEIAW
ncbi:MAG: SDR family oxidoreductase [Bdellovibrionaceae bacterium]|nr:SDR family oxidoreductase [Pseudobdellovibrionaceae bacterium]